MKSIRQKAKAYDKALEIVRPYYEEAIKSEKTAPIELFESMFDELRDNDERIRKEIIDYIKIRANRKDWIVWLEKQGEQNPYSGVSFRYNDNIWGMCARDNGVDILFNKKLIQHISGEKQDEQKPYGQREECLDCQFNYTGECKGSCAMKSSEHNPTEWSEEDELMLLSIIQSLETTNGAAQIKIDWLKTIKQRIEGE